MTILSLGRFVQTSGRKRWHLATPRRREQAAVLTRKLDLLAAGTGVPLTMVEGDPMLPRPAVEDLCWRLESEDQGRHRPHRGHSGARARGEPSRSTSKPSAGAWPRWRPRPSARWSGTKAQT